MRITVVSPFVDKKHGTERCLAELIERLVCDYQCEIHLYAERVEDVPLQRMTKGSNESGPGIRWHKVAAIPGPHLVQYVWWFVANASLRWWHTWSGKCLSDVLLSPGINAWNPDVIHVHIVFEEFWQRMKNDLRFRSTPFLSWPLLCHRRLYYGLIRWLETQIYPKKQVQLAAVSQMVQRQLATYFNRYDTRCVRNGVNRSQFAPGLRMERRSQSRNQLEIPSERFVFLLIGNDWRKKGLQSAIEAFGMCPELPLHLLVVGRDDARPFLSQIQELHMRDRITFLAPAGDIMNFYAAADAYLGPSLEDAFGLPVLEAMACGLPVIASANAGVAEVIEDRSNGLLLHDPADVTELASLIRTMVSDSALRAVLASNASKTAEHCTWDESAAALWEVLKQTLADKRSSSHKRRYRRFLGGR